MSTSSAQLHAYGFTSAKTYLFSIIFIAGNILLPQLAHLIPQGGLIFLPIYFFTLIAAYKFGLKVGLITAVFSPLINSLLFGMPMLAMLPIILIKSTLLAVAAAFAAKYFGKISLLAIILAVVAYQIVGGMAEWAMTGSFAAAVQDFRLGLPGILLQIFGGFAVLKLIKNI
jgi:hypothetical protein